MLPEINICKTDNDFSIAKKITTDYMEWLGIDLCFQNIDNEFAIFNKMYSKPEGCYIYATYNKVIIGGVAVRSIDKNICEMKRLFVYDNYRGLNIGVLLCNEIIRISKELGYKEMRLDTVSKLKNAIKLYENLGFSEIPAYYDNPEESVKYMGLKL